MNLSQNNLIVEHHLLSLGSEKMEEYVAHVICTQGVMTFVFNGTSFSLQEGESMIIITQQLVEQLTYSSNFKATSIYIKPKFLELCTPRSNYGIRGTLALYACPIMRMSKEQFASLKEDFEQIEKRLNHNQNYFQEDLLICATQMMILDFFDIHASHNGLANISLQDDDIVTRFIQLLEQGSYIKHRNVTYYADKLFVTPKYLSEVCKSVSGKTANYWITRFTVIHVRKLLQQKEMTFKEIADALNFSSSAYFSRFVQKHLGTSPTHLRE